MIEWLGGLGLGILIGTILYKYLSGTADVEEEAFEAGYGEGYDEGLSAGRREGWHTAMRQSRRDC